jgi:hypothetical protein
MYLFHPFPQLLATARLISILSFLPLSLLPNKKSLKQTSHPYTASMLNGLWLGPGHKNIVMIYVEAYILSNISW